MRSLATVLTTEYGLDLTGWVLDDATSISADGRTIAGIGSNPNGQTEAWIAHLEPNANAVPEPASFALLGIGGLGCVIGYHRKKRRTECQ
jgi:hypothetical protein